MSKLQRELGKLLNDKQLEMVAQSNGIPLAGLKAIIEVETRGRGFYNKTLIPVVRLENHKFSELTKGKYDQSHPHLSSPDFTNTYNRAGLGEYDRFEEAYALDGKAAVYATSWGIGQVMGSNWRACGYDNLNKFLQDAFTSEYTQLLMMFYFIAYHPKPMLDYIRHQKWDKFARHYNGANYKQNDYDTKLANAFTRYNDKAAKH